MVVALQLQGGILSLIPCRSHHNLSCRTRACYISTGNELKLTVSAVVVADRRIAIAVELHRVVLPYIRCIDQFLLSVMGGKGRLRSGVHGRKGRCRTRTCGRSICRSLRRHDPINVFQGCCVSVIVSNHIVQAAQLQRVILPHIAHMIEGKRGYPPTRGAFIISAKRNL